MSTGLIEDVLSREIIRDNTLPVLLGGGKRARHLAKRIYSSFGIVSAIYYRELDLPGALHRMTASSAVYLKRSCTEDGRSLCEELTALSAENEGVLVFLVPCDGEAESFVMENRETLESAFVVCGPDELYDHIPRVTR